MDRRSPARFLAPLALVAAVVALFVVLGSSGKSGGGSSRHTRTGAAKVHHHRAHHPAKHAPRVYIVKSNDLLSTIAQKTGISVDQILQLNPGLDPQALVPGQKIKLR